MIDVHEIGPERAADVVEVIHAGFGSRAVLEPASTATLESEESVAAALAGHGGLLATSELAPAGALLFEPDGAALRLRRVAVEPDSQGRGVARALVRRAEQVAAARGYGEVRATARTELPRTGRFWERQGYTEVAREGTTQTFAKALPVEVETRSGDEAQALGERLAKVLRAGDLVLLSGDLGAGKTTLTQGIGAGLGARGGITSPTFVISRVHPSLGDGPPLVHVDAYRLGGIEELDDLDLDTSLDDAVTVVEWGEGVAEGLADTRLEVRISRARGGEATDQDSEDHDPRTMRFVPVGARWLGSGLREALA